MKNKFKIITLLLVIILSISVPIVRAEDEINSDSQSEELYSINLDAEHNENEEAVDSEDEEDAEDDELIDHDHSVSEEMKRHDVYLAGDDITIDYIVDGNLFVVANSVTIDSQIGGDAFICAKEVNITEDGYIYSNLFVVSEKIDINGIVYDVFALAQNLSITDGYIYRDLKAACQNLNIFGTIGRDVYTDCENISFLDKDNKDSHLGTISGDLKYSSEKEFEIPENAVAGEINHYEKNITETNIKNEIQDTILSIGTTITTVVVIWLLCLWIAPKFEENTSNLISKKVLPSLGIGLLTPIVTVVASIILLITGITSTIGFLTIGLFILLLCISNAIFIIALNNFICQKFKIEKKVSIGGMLILSTLVISIIKLIPYLGGIVGFLVSIIGLGMIIISIPVNIKKEKKNNEIKEESK